MATWPPVPSCHFLLPTPLIGRGRANVGLLSVCLLSLQDFGHSNPVCPGCSLCHSIIGLNVLFILYEEGKICIQNAPSRIPLRSQWQRLLKRVNDKGNETIIHNLGQLGHMGEWTYEPNWDSARKIMGGTGISDYLFIQWWFSLQELSHAWIVLRSPHSYSSPDRPTF